MTLDLLQEELLLRAELNVPTLCNNPHKVAERMEAELGDERQQFVENDPNGAAMNLLPEPKPPLAVRLDGAHANAARRELRKEGGSK